MTNQPDDDTIKNLAKVIGDIISRMSANDPHFVGCTIISGNNVNNLHKIPLNFGGAGGMGQHGRIKLSSDDLVYEIMEAENRLYITVELPPDVSVPPTVEVGMKSVRICLEVNEYTIDIPCPIIAGKCITHVANGILDIECLKESIYEETLAEPYD